MDMNKIGKYIAENRKKQGLTQKQLADKLGMSDKSVSKWERGVCLPDVSIYAELCHILNISINEFLAGEDIREEDRIIKSEDNLIQIARDSDHRQKSLKRIIRVLIVLLIIAILVSERILLLNLAKPKNYVEPIAKDSIEMKVAEIMSFADGPYIFNYRLKDEFEELTLYVSEYRQGEFVKKTELTWTNYEGMESAKEGMLAIVPDFDNGLVSVAVTDESSKTQTSFPILEHVDGWDYGRSASQIEEQKAIEFGCEQGLLALIYDGDILRVMPVSDLEDGNFPEENDYLYYITYKFTK